MEDFFSQLPAMGGIFGLAFFSFWSAIPAGLVLGLSPLVIIAVTTLSYLTGILVVLLPGERIRAWVIKRWGSEDRQSSLDANSRLYRIWQRFGVVGFGLLAPMTLGAQLGTIVGLSLNIQPRRLFLWMAIGAVSWSVVLTLLISLGVLSVQSLSQ